MTRHEADASSKPAGRTPSSARTDRAGLARIAVAGLIWGSIPLVIRAADGASAIKVFYRVFFAAIVLIAFMTTTGRMGEITGLSRRKLGQIAVQGAILTLNWFLFLTALDLTTVATAELLGYTGPVFVAALSPLVTKEPFDRRIIAPLALALGGIVVILAPQGLAVAGGAQLLGALMAFASALTYATLLLRSKNILKGVSGGALMVVEYTMASVILLPFVVVLYARGQGPTSARSYAALAILGIVHTAFTGILFLGGLRRVRTDRAAILTYAEPVSAVVFAAIFLGEPLTAATIAGGAMVVAGGLVVSRLEPPSRTRAHPDGGGRSRGVLPKRIHSSEGRPTRTWEEVARVDSMQRLLECEVITRLAEHDASLFAEDDESREAVMQRMGWIGLAPLAIEQVPFYEVIAQQLVDEGATDVVVLGMGGSSLASLVFSRVFGPAGAHPRVHVLDTTSPITVAGLLRDLDPARTWFLVSSKSGTTIEPLSLYAIFRGWTDAALGHDRAGTHFIAITDPGTPLQDLRGADAMRLTVPTPANVGGRFSALTAFGLVPAALLGVDLRGLLSRATDADQRCRIPDRDNPAAELAAWIADRRGAGSDKLTVVASERFASFPLWIEQLVAESTGKQGLGIVPVVESSPRPASDYGADRALVAIRASDDEALRSWAEQVRAAGLPVFDIELPDPLDLGAEFVRWEYATALVGLLLGINPFDEPDVGAAKAATIDVLDGTSTLPAGVDIDGVVVTYAGGLTDPATAPSTLADALERVLSSVGPGDYLAILAYVPDEDARLAPLRRAATAISAARGNAVCVELGPRYLHSTGQLHKGGPNDGVFVVITARDADDVEVPGQAFSLARLHRAQAEGDLVTLAARGRRVAHVDVQDSTPATLEVLGRALVSG